MSIEKTINQLVDNTPIFVCKLPKQIVGEIKLEKRVKKIKNHPLGYLKSHEKYNPNAERLFNSYHPTHMIEDYIWHI